MIKMQWYVMGWSFPGLHSPWNAGLQNLQQAVRVQGSILQLAPWTGGTDCLSQAHQQLFRTRGNRHFYHFFHKPRNMPSVQNSTSTKKWSTHVQKCHPSRPLSRYSPVSPAKGVWTNPSAALPYLALVSPLHPFSIMDPPIIHAHPIQPMIWVWDRTPKPGYPIITILQKYPSFRHITIFHLILRLSKKKMVHNREPLKKSYASKCRSLISQRFSSDVQCHFSFKYLEDMGKILWHVYFVP